MHVDGLTIKWCYMLLLDVGSTGGDGWRRGDGGPAQSHVPENSCSHYDGEMSEIVDQ